jgi:biopolymer transport protein ExbB
MKRAKYNVCHFLLLGILLSLLGATPALAWWKPEWTLRKRLVIDTGPNGAALAEPIGGTPVLVRLHDGNFPFAAAKPDGSDLRLVAGDDKTPLAFHLEKFDSLLNEAFVWVRVPDLKPGAQTTIWLYYGNGGSSVARADDVKGTYDGETVLVYHFAERGQPAADASGLNNNSLNAGPSVDGAMIGGGLRFDGRAAVTIPASASMAWADAAPLTWSVWVKLIAPQPRAAIFRRQDGPNGVTVGFDQAIPFVEIASSRGPQRTPAAAPVAPNTWHQLAVISGGGNTTLFLDGEVYATLAASVPALNTPALVGGEGTNGAAGFTGEIDELEISKIARPPGFIKFAAGEQGGEKSAKILAMGEEEQPKSWFSFIKTGYVGIIIGSLSIDGWVVIGVLILMSIVSWIVMIGKGRYLNLVGAGNEQFLKDWRLVASDLSVLDHEDSEHVKSLGGRVDATSQRVMRNAPLFRVYHVGVEEIRHRLAADRNNKVLSARSIQAIRAALDGSLVRETHRLSSQMVLLTIAISGGPFLGLLGTVVGVMITFAAVAAAGDVNVNAIAPGIAAALAATVAGLAVAIPALFGYNYLLTRIKAATSDMHVFIDEFVAKMAEFYAEPADASRAITRSAFAPSEPNTPQR